MSCKKQNKSRNNRQIQGLLPLQQTNWKKKIACFSCCRQNEDHRGDTATLLAWNPSTGLLTYFSEGATKTVSILPSTRVQRAPIHQFLPNDPIRPLLLQWNSLIASGQTTFGTVNPNTPLPLTFSAILGQLAAAGAHMRIRLESRNSTIVASLHPIP